jgi:hypothetical protein
MCPSDPEELTRLAALIQAKLVSGKLPYDSIPRVWGGPGNGESCDACERTITSWELIMEGIASDGGGGIQFHVRCFYLWDALRRSAPSNSP